MKFTVHLYSKCTNYVLLLIIIIFIIIVIRIIRFGSFKHMLQRSEFKYLKFD